jgi:hypothetical protein
MIKYSAKLRSTPPSNPVDTPKERVNLDELTSHRKRRNL